jgi:hypothetical protein
MQDEIDAHVTVQKSITPIKSLPKNASVVGTKFVYKIKLHKDGTLEKYKSRFVGQGFTQNFGKDYTDTFAPASQVSSLRILFALASHYSMSVFHVDVVTAFLNADLKEELYVKFPPGITIQNCQFGKLNKSIYGLKQAAHDWSKLSEAALKKHFPELKRSGKEPCLYYNITDTRKVLILVHVDDYMVATNDEQWYHETFVRKFKTSFNINDLGKADQALGCGVYQEVNGDFRLSQQRTIEDLGKRYGIELSNPTYSPMEQNLHLPLATVPETLIHTCPS